MDKEVVLAEIAEASLAHLIAANILLFTHALFVVFVVFGLVLILVGKIMSWSWVRNPWFRCVHILAIGIVVIQSWLGVSCPLTVWEMTLRSKAGAAVYAGSFVSHWVESILYYRAPEWVFMVCYTFFGLLVLVSWWWVRPHPFSEKNE